MWKNVKCQMSIWVSHSCTLSSLPKKLHNLPSRASMWDISTLKRSFMSILCCQKAFRIIQNLQHKCLTPPLWTMLKKCQGEEHKSAVLCYITILYPCLALTPVPQDAIFKKFSRAHLCLWWHCSASWGTLFPSSSFTLPVLTWRLVLLSSFLKSWESIPVIQYRSSYK